MHPAIQVNLYMRIINDLVMRYSRSDVSSNSGNSLLILGL